MRTGMLVACAALALPAIVAAGAPAHGRQEPPAAEVTADARDQAIRRAFEYLDARMWELSEHGSPQKQYTIAMAAWASLLAGDREGGASKLPSRAKELERLRKYLERYVTTVAGEYERADEKGKRRGREEPEPEGGLESLAAGKPAQYVWPVAMAAHYFAESVARGRDKASARQGLKDAIAVLEAAQQPNGGWGHDDATRPGMGLPPIRIPKPGGGELDYPGTLLAASTCALSALGVAHAKLGSKAPASLGKGIEYFRAAQNENGSFPYDPSQRHAMDARHVQNMMGGEIEFARTPGAFFALACAGVPATSKELKLAARAMDQHPEAWSEGHGSAALALQFAALAARARGDAAWSAFRSRYFPRILACQTEGGAFTCIAEAKSAAVTVDTAPFEGLPGSSGWTENQKVYVTSIHTLILLLDRSRPQAIPAMPPPDGPKTGTGAGSDAGRAGGTRPPGSGGS